MIVFGVGATRNQFLPVPLDPGCTVVPTLGAGAQDLAAERVHALPHPPLGLLEGPRRPHLIGWKVPYLKTARGVPGMRIDVGKDGTVILDGAPAGLAKTHALDGRPLAAIAPGTIPPGHFYLHADHADSHDSRYAEIGLVPRGRILGRAIAMPDIPWLGLEGPLVGPEDVGEAGAATILPHPAVEAPR